MGFTIIIAAGKYEPAALATLLISKFGATVARKVCSREVFIAGVLDHSEDLAYWRQVAAELERLDSTTELETPEFHASSEEGLRLNNIFSRLVDPASRQRVLDLAVSQLRQSPIE